LATGSLIQNLDIALLPYLVSTGARAEKNAEFKPSAPNVRRAPGKPDGRHSVGATSGRGITQVLHEKSCALIHATAQIDKHLVRIAYLDKSKARIFEIDNQIRSHRQDDGECE